IHRAPLANIDGFAIGQGKLSVSGLVLPPDGDPRLVSVTGEKGVAYEFIYPLPSPSARDIYWYWPNGDYSGYQLVIDLAQTRHIGTSYAFMFGFGSGDVDKCADIKNTFWIPKEINAYQNYPPQDNLKRVQAFDNISGVTVRGYSDSRRIWEIANRYGLDCTGAKVLDWGAGHGRVIRHFHSLDTSVRAYSIDIDEENVAWAREHLAAVFVSHGPLMPPTVYPNDEFDLIYGISVMTHLTRSVQKAWLGEIRRILSPGGRALLTFAGDTATAFSSRFLDKTWMEGYLYSGRGRDLPSDDLVGKISDPNYYKNVTISSVEVARLCEPYFEVLDVLECMFGYQDLAVLAKAA
ncbi:MAG: class I SAM-dependent methyltransferase, partial [Methylococcales bacterium]